MPWFLGQLRMCVCNRAEADDSCAPGYIQGRLKSGQQARDYIQGRGSRVRPSILSPQDVLALRECPPSWPVLGGVLFAGLPWLTGGLAMHMVICQLVALSAGAAPNATLLQAVVCAAAIVHVAVVEAPFCATGEFR